MPHTIVSILRAHRSFLIAVATAGAAVALVLSIVQPLKYRATMRFLVIQATTPTLDAFTAVKSSEKIAGNLGRVIASSSFLERVLQAQPDIDRDTFPTDEHKRRRAWERTVATSVLPETSVMELRVYHARAAQARTVAEGVAGVLVRDANRYTGSADISVQVIDPPLVSRFPVKPNIPANVLIGFLLGGVLGAVWRYLFPRHHR